MLKKGIVAFAACCLLAAATADELSGTLSTPLHQAEALEESGNWGDLLVMAENWTDTDGANWQSWYYYGFAQLKLGQSEQAVKTLSTALKLSSRNNDKLLLLIADSYVAIADWLEAERAYRELLTRYPNNATLWDKLRNVIESYLQSNPPNRHDTELALIDILRAQLKFAPHVNNYHLWKRNATLLDALGMTDEARAAYKHVLRLKPDDLPAVEWVFAYDLAGADADTLEKTIAHLQRLDPNNPLLNMHLAEQALAEKNRRRAREYYERVSQNKQYPMQQSLALSGLGDLTSGRKKEEALQYYQQAIDIAPSNIGAWEQIVVILRAQKKNKLARQYFTRLQRAKKFVSDGAEVPRTLLDGLKEEAPKQ